MAAQPDGPMEELIVSGAAFGMFSSFHAMNLLY